MAGSRAMKQVSRGAKRRARPSTLSPEERRNLGTKDLGVMTAATHIRDRRQQIEDALK